MSCNSTNQLISVTSVAMKMKSELLMHVSDLQHASYISNYISSQAATAEYCHLGTSGGGHLSEGGGGGKR
jgi:hypothetical protein